MTAIIQTVGHSLSESVALVEFSKQQTTCIRGDIAPIKIGCNLLAKKTFKTKLFVADCIHKGILARDCFIMW